MAQDKGTAPQTVTEDGIVTPQELAVRGPSWDDETLLGISSFDDALALVSSTLGGEIVEASDSIGNGFTILNGAAKDILIGVPVLFMSWTFNLGDNGEFVSAQCVARMPGGGSVKAIVNDGSTGIYRQLAAYTSRTQKMGGLLTRRGLTRSDYKYDDNGTQKDASTYYIDTTAG